MRVGFIFINTFILTTVCLLTPILQAADWPGFLGPNRNGQSEEKGLIDAIPATGLKELWRVKIGVGMSNAAIVNDQVFTVTHRTGQQTVLALDAKTGKEIWAQGFAAAYKNSQGDGPRATPTVDGDQIFVFGGGGTLAALSKTDGKLLWSQNVVKENNGKSAEYGMASSPLIIGDLVIVQAGVSSAAVVAYNRKSGKLVWQVGNDTAGYASPVLLELAGTPQVVAFNGKSVLGIAPQTGKQLWRYPYKTDYDCNTANPVLCNGQLLISSGENHGSAMLSVKRVGDEYQVSEVWTSQGNSSTLRSEWQTSVLIDGYLYGFDNVGSAGPVSHLTCVEMKTGKQVWQATRFGKGNLIAADGKLFISTVKGELVLAKASPTKYEELGRTKLVGFTRQAPVISNGRLFLRDNKDIVCVAVKK